MKENVNFDKTRHARVTVMFLVPAACSIHREYFTISKSHLRIKRLRKPALLEDVSLLCEGGWMNLGSWQCWEGEAHPLSLSLSFIIHIVCGTVGLKPRIAPWQPNKACQLQKKKKKPLEKQQQEGNMQYIYFIYSIYISYCYDSFCFRHDVWAGFSIQFDLFLSISFQAWNENWRKVSF